MVFLAEHGLMIGRLILAVVLLLILLVPAWWLAGRIQDGGASPFFRLVCSLGLLLVGYLTFVNLVGRLMAQSTAPIWLFIGCGVIAALFLVWRWPSESSFTPLLRSWRSWWGLILIALLLGLPQWLLAVSTPYWDEVASSAIHVTGANQIAEGLFPPRHNALPEVAIKYHYGFIMLSGGIKWLTGLTANVSIDIASTALWLFAFLLAVEWLRALGLGLAPALWGGFSLLLGGGLAWLNLPRVEAYQAFWISPRDPDLLHRYDGELGLLENLLESAEVPSAYLRNPDGTLSNLPWDIAAQFQQHAVALGLALTLFTLYLFVTWYRGSRYRSLLLAMTILAFAVLPLAHAVFGAVAAVTAASVLLLLWLWRPTGRGFIEGLVFGLGLTVCALLHGGLLSLGAEYGSSSEVLTGREILGYSRGGLSGFIDWNLAGFGLPLLLTLVAWGASVWRLAMGPRGHVWTHDRELSAAELTFLVLTLLTLLSYLVPQLAYYTSESSRIEQQTEISKFFFVAHLGFALLSAFGVALLLRRLHWALLIPAGAAMAVTPLAFVYVHSTSAQRDAPRQTWKGFYRAPYFPNSVEQRMGETLRSLKGSNRDQYFDSAASERTHGYLSELLIFGGSLFTLTPSRYERTGSGYRLAQEVVARRFVQNGRMARLLPGAAEESGVTWLYSKPARDWADAPLIVRARFAKLIAEGYLVEKLAAGPRALYSIARPTADLDTDILRYWRPRIVSQAKTDWDGDGRDDLIFFDPVARRILIGSHLIQAPAWVSGDFTLLFVGHFPGDQRVDFHLGRLLDTEFRFGRSMSDLIEQSSWGWSYLASTSSTWDPEYPRWGWDGDIPIVADLDADGLDTHLMFRPRTGEWIAAPNRPLAGPKLDEGQLPLPFAGRFFRDSRGDLGLWGQTASRFVIQDLANGQRLEFNWGSGHSTDVLVPADYNGDGYDEIALWNRDNQFWYWRTPPDGPITQLRFGTPTAVPVPADYNHDGRVDPAYWEPAEGKIHVTFSQGREIDLSLDVPPNAIPAFVNMH